MTKKIWYLLGIYDCYHYYYSITYITIHCTYDIFVSKLTKYSRHFLVKSAPSFMAGRRQSWCDTCTPCRRNLARMGSGWHFFHWLPITSCLVQPPQFTKFHTLSLITSPFWSVPILPNPSQLCVVQEGFGAGHLDDFAGLVHHEVELRVVPGTLQLARGGSYDEGMLWWMAIRHYMNE